MNKSLSNRIANQLRYNINYNNRDIIAIIIINELEVVLNHVDFIQDRQKIQDMIKCLYKNVGTHNPMKLLSLCDLKIN